MHAREFLAPSFSPYQQSVTVQTSCHHLVQNSSSISSADFYDDGSGEGGSRNQGMESSLDMTASELMTKLTVQVALPQLLYAPSSLLV